MNTNWRIANVTEAKALYSDFKRVKEDIEFSITNGDYPLRSDVCELLQIAENALEFMLFDLDY